MKILYLLTRDLEGAGAELQRELAREHAVEVIDLRGKVNYDLVVDAIAAADRVISW